MKKVLIVLALVALVLAPVAAKGATAVGGEFGEPTGATFRYAMEDKWDGYVTVGGSFWGSHGYLNAAAGAEIKVAEFNIDKAKFNVNVGAQVGFDFSFNKDYAYTAIAARGTASVSYDFSFNNKSDWTVYIRLGAGAKFKLSGEAELNLFSLSGVLGLVYHL